MGIVRSRIVTRGRGRRNEATWPLLVFMSVYRNPLVLPHKTSIRQRVRETERERERERETATRILRKESHLLARLLLFAYNFTSVISEDVFLRCLYGKEKKGDKIISA